MSDALVSPTPAEATPSAPAPVAATPATPAAPVAAAIPQATPQAPATGAAPEGWVPSYRLRESREAAVREANEQFAQRESALRAEMERYRQQVQSLVGVTPPPNPEITAVRNQFGQIYPGLSKLEDQAEKIAALLERSGDLEAQNEHYWQMHGQRTMDRLYSQAQTSLGAPLTDEGKRALHSAFVGFVQQSPELGARYANDPTLVDEFWQVFTSSLIDPARRAASATVVGRAAANIPQDTPAGLPRPAAAPQPTNLDDRASSAWALYQQNARK